MERIRGLASDEKVRAAVEALNDKIRNVNRSNVAGPPTTQAVIDVEKVVARWRAERQG